MKLQITSQEIADALASYFKDYKGLKLTTIELGVKDADCGEYCGPDQEDFYALADFEVVP